MKKMFLLAGALIIVLMLGMMSVFADDEIKVKGTVTNINMAAKSVTIQPKEGKAVTVVMEDADLLSKVREGGKGQAIYVLKDGVNVGIKLKKLSAGCE